MQHQNNDIDSQLIKKIIGDDVSALAELYLRHHKKLVDIAYSNVHNRDEAECLVFNYFIFQLWDNRKKLVDVVNIENYLRSAIWKRSVTHYKKLQREKKYKASLPTTDSIPPDDTMEVEDYREALRIQLQMALNKLPPKIGKTIELFFLKNMNYEEIGEILDLKLPSVTNYVYEGLKSLAKNKQLKAFHT